MFVDDVLEERSRRTLLVVGCAGGLFVGATLTVLVYAGASSPAIGGRSRWLVALFISILEGHVIPINFDANVDHTLRVLQSIGILLPLFTGLLRFTADDQSNVGKWVTDYLFVGIFGLVVAGLFATLGGIMADTTPVLKLSLLPVLITFTLVGVAAMGMLGETDNSTNESEGPRMTPIRPTAEARDDGTETDEPSEHDANNSENRGDNKRETETQTELTSKVLDRDADETGKRAEAGEPSSTISSEFQYRNYYDGEDTTSEGSSESKEDLNG